MKKISVILTAILIGSVLIWKFMESREEGAFASHAALTETPVPFQAAGASFTYNFDSDTVGVMRKVS